MGHNRLGRLPKTRRWAAVMGMLDILHPDPAAIAKAVAEASENRLRELTNDPGLGYSFWLITRIALAARGQDFVGDLAKLNIKASPNASTLEFISQVADIARIELSKIQSSGDFAEIGSMAIRTALTETVGQQGRSMFETSLRDIQSAFKIYSTQVQFGNVAHRFFSNFLARVILSYVDRDIANHLGVGKGFADLGDSKSFLEALDIHTRQSARIVEEFAGAWYSKHNWETKGDISREETQRFTAYALRKLRSELKMQTQNQ